eukprot:CAMPEP_0172323160 /NCGR_PEP_ID=MMETSP1058-20130122/48002_1 /TAXON_ID=83371 /ORGANISM="Detonula confervacea, Strain CCMP 353" /LENGTH=712 /DNA_ID=CAMNT_0013039093 /DNA_START=183 /DNA_END=2321 /DNA_ORIENTATION=+
MKSNNMSVHDRIKALNLNKRSGNTPPRQNRQGSSLNDPDSPRPVAAASSSKPPPSSPSSEKAQLFKAAKVIQKSFDAETDVLCRTLAGGAGAVSIHRPLQRSSPKIEEGAHDVDENTGYLSQDSEYDDEEFDASTALNFWRTKGITEGGPRSYKEAPEEANLAASNRRRSSASGCGEGGDATNDDNSAVHASSITSQQGSQDTNIISTSDTSQGEAQLQPEEAKPPSPPDIVRTANTNSDMEHDVVEDEDNINDNEDNYEQQEQDERGAFDNVTSEDRSELEIMHHETNEDVPSDEEPKKPSQPITADNTIRTEIVPPLKTDMDVPKDEAKKPRHVMSSSTSSAGIPYRAYARRSRLRSPRGIVISPDNSMEMDGTQSVVSACTAHSTSSQATALSQMSTLSSRATRFLKVKKDKRRGTAASTGFGGAAGTDRAPGASNPKPEVFAKDMTHNILWGKAAKARTKQKAASGAAAANYKQEKEDFKLPGKRKTGSPRTIDLQPALPKVDRISGLNIDVGAQRQYAMDHTADSQVRDVSSSRKEYQSHAYGIIHAPIKNDSRDYQKKDKGRSYFDHTVSMDESSCSELKAKDLFDIGKQGNDIKIRPSSTLSEPATLESNTEFAAFPRGGKSFDSGCQVFEAINPLIESAYNAFSSGSQVFSNPSRVVTTTFCNDAPSDEDVAIEVEYVEQGEDRSLAETDSIYSVSTRDLDSYA